MILLAVLAHVAQAYQSKPEAESLVSLADIGERYLDPNRTPLAERFLHVARIAVNPMLFLLAGFSWAFLIKRRGLRSIAWNRTTRILIPLVVTWLVAFPLIRYSFALGRHLMLAGEGEASLVAAFADTPLTPYLPFAREVFYLAHVWFLYYLLLFYAASLALLVWLDRPAGAWRRRLCSFQTAVLVGDLRWMRLPLLVSLLVFATLTDGNPELDISHRLLPDPETFAAHYVFFLVGWLFALHREILDDLNQRAGLRFLLGLLLAILVVTPMGENHLHASTPADFWLGSSQLQLRIYWLSHAIASWMIVLGMLGLAHRWFQRVDVRCAYVAEAAFWIYLVHLPFAIFIPVLFHNWSLDANLKVCISTATVLLICFVSYHFLVRRTVVGQWLRGRYRRPTKQL